MTKTSLEQTLGILDDFPPLSEAQFSNYSNKDSIDIVDWQQNNVDFTLIV